MNIIFSQKELAKALNIVQSAAQNKVTSNTNNGILLTAVGNIIEFQANDYAVAIKTKCPGVIHEGGNIVIASTQLASMIKLLPPGDVICEQKASEGFITFKTDNVVYRFPIRTTEEFPRINELDKVNSCTVDSEALADMANLVQFAAATDKQKPFFTGVLFDIKDDTFAMAATNTHRLATKEMKLPVPSEHPGRLIVPASALSEVMRLLSQEEDELVEITWAKQHVAFSFGDTYFLSNLISGEYPDYKRVIPTQFALRAEMNLADIRSAVSMVTPISRDMSYKTINFNFENNQLDIYEEDKSIGSSRIVIPCRMDGDNLHIIFNCFYIEDILKHSKGDTVIFNLMKNGPLLVEQEKDKAYRYVVTPMRGHQ